MSYDDNIMSFLKRVALENDVPHEIKEEAFNLYVGGKALNSKAKTPIEMVKCLELWQFMVVQEKILTGLKIQAIKNLRAYTDMGLKDAKDCVENPGIFKQLPTAPVPIEPPVSTKPRERLVDW